MRKAMNTNRKGQIKEKGKDQKKGNQAKIKGKRKTSERPLEFGKGKEKGQRELEKCCNQTKGIMNKHKGNEATAKEH